MKVGDFNGLSGLEELNLSQNDLSTLPAGVFDDLSSLNSLNLSYNDLTSLPVGLLSGLSNLTELDFMWNDIGQLPAGAFDGLTNLRKLDVTLNYISQLPAGVFDDLSSLQELNLGANNLSSLRAGVFDNLSSLQTLGLGANELTSLRSDVFDDLSTLKYLYLHDNNLTELPDGAFEGLSVLSRVWVYENPGAPFTLTVELQPRGDSSFAVAVAEGTPSTMTITLSAEGGTLSNTTVGINRGSLASDEIEVTPSDGNPVVTVSVSAVAIDRASDYQGVQTGMGEARVFHFNALATGVPTISGTPRVGQTLTTDTSGIEDSDGLSGVVYRYQWLSSRDTEIDGATNPTLVLQSVHANKVISVRVTFTDEAGNEESLTSEVTAPVAVGGL